MPRCVPWSPWAIPTPVVEQVATLLDAGLDGVVFNMPDALDLAAVPWPDRHSAAAVRCRWATCT